MTPANTKLWYLMNMDFFNGLSSREYDIIDRDSSVLRVRKRENIPFCGTADKNIYFIKQGRIKLMKLTPDGRGLTLDIMKEGTLFGEMSSEGQHTEDVLAEALQDCMLCVMKKSNFDRLIAEVPLLSKRLIKLIGLRFKRIENRLSDLLYSTIEERLARILLSLANDFGVENNGSLILKIKLTHNDIAELIASTRETVTATLNEFRQSALIDYADRFIVITDVMRLTALSGKQTAKFISNAA
jgi:CRP/FNR family transcriptional regulator